MPRVITIILVLVQSLVALGQNQNISQGNVFDGEPFLAINPNNAQHIVVAWMGWVNLSNQFKIKTKTSFDGGQTWSVAVEIPHTISTYSSADPSLDFDHEANVYLCFIDFTGTTPPVTGGVYLNKSTDGGLSWSESIEVINSEYDGVKWPIDRPWMEIDKSSGPNQGNIYITTMNLNQNDPSFHPYLSVSSDGGNSFENSYIDTIDWLAGSINPKSMCSPALSSTGIFYGAYPSLEFSQSPFLQTFLATSIDGGTSLSHSNVITYNSPTNLVNFPFAKKGSLLLSNPANPDHLAFIFPSATNGDIDVFLVESLNAGSSWTSPERINDDPIGNNRMQDLIWGGFDLDGDLIISWRDRRNGTDSTYQTQSEIWAAFRDMNSNLFSSNFQITDQTVAFDTILESAGNDFMSIKIQNDTIYSSWGDTRDGRLNIWFQKLTTDGIVISVQQISSEFIPEIFIYPNPTSSSISIEGEDLEKINVFDFAGKKLFTKQNEFGLERMNFTLESYPIGTYIIEVQTKNGKLMKKIIKE